MSTPLTRRSNRVFAQRSLRIASVKDFIIIQAGISLCNEVTSLCSNFILCDKSPGTLKQFTWRTLLDEVEGEAPTLIKLLQCSHTKKSNVIIALEFSKGGFQSNSVWPGGGGGGGG